MIWTVYPTFQSVCLSSFLLACSTVLHSVVSSTLTPPVCLCPWICLVIKRKTGGRGGGTNFKNITISCNRIILHWSCVFLFDNKDTFSSLDLTGSSINEHGRSGSNLQDFTNVCALSTVSDERSLKCTHRLIYLVLKSSSIVCHYFNNSDKNKKTGSHHFLKLCSKSQTKKR